MYAIQPKPYRADSVSPLPSYAVKWLPERTDGLMVGSYTRLSTILHLDRKGAQVVAACWIMLQPEQGLPVIDRPNVAVTRLSVPTPKGLMSVRQGSETQSGG